MSKLVISVNDIPYWTYVGDSAKDVIDQWNDEFMFYNHDDREFSPLVEQLIETINISNDEKIKLHERLCNDYEEMYNDTETDDIDEEYENESDVMNSWFMNWLSDELKDYGNKYKNMYYLSDVLTRKDYANVLYKYYKDCKGVQVDML